MMTHTLFHERNCLAKSKITCRALLLCRMSLLGVVLLLRFLVHLYLIWLSLSSSSYIFVIFRVAVYCLCCWLLFRLTSHSPILVRRRGFSYFHCCCGKVATQCFSNIEESTCDNNNMFAFHTQDKRIGN